MWSLETKTRLERELADISLLAALMLLFREDSGLARCWIDPSFTFAFAPTCKLSPNMQKQTARLVHGEAVLRRWGTRGKWTALALPPGEHLTSYRQQLRIGGPELLLPFSSFAPAFS